MMKRILSFYFLLSISGFILPSIGFGQGADTLPVYKQFPFVPSFQLMKADSSLFYMKDAIPKNQAAVVIIFSPGCGHCRYQAREITGHIQALSGIQFLFATGYPIPEMKQFINEFGLHKFKNITVGQDKGLNLASFYKIKGLPGIFVYNKKGELVTEFYTNVSAGTLAEAVKK